MRRQRTAYTAQGASGEQGFWPSYADMMSAVALILFFLMLLAYVQNMITGRNLKNTEELLESTTTLLSETEESLSETKRYLLTTEQSLSDTQKILADTELELDAKNDELILTVSKVSEAEGRLNDITAELEGAHLTLSQQQEQMTEQEQALAAQAALLADQDAYLRAANDEILEMRSTMQTIAVFRLSVLEQVRDSLVAVTGDSSSVGISDNGNIVLSASILFDSGSFEIKPEANPALDQLINVFVSFLKDNDSAAYVDSIVISGHTDSDGNDESNRKLSTERANAVLNYMLDPANGSLSEYSSFFCAAGYGESRPVASNNTEAGKAENRRIEISITLKDESVMDIVERYLDLDVPEA